MVHIVHQPFQAEGLRHLHAWHCVPERNCGNVFKLACFTFPQPKYILNLFKSPAVHLIGKEKNRQPPRLDVWVLQKKVATSLRAKKSLSAISRENRHQAFRLRYQSCVTAPAAACPARPWPPPSSTGRWSPPRRWCPARWTCQGSWRWGGAYLAVSVVVLPQVPVPSLARHVKGGEADVSVWKDNMSKEGHFQHLFAVILINSAIEIQNQGKTYTGHAVNSPPALSGTIPFLVSWVNTSTSALCMAPFKDGEDVLSCLLSFHSIFPT